MFSEKEREYITKHRLTRIATVSPDGQPDVAAVRFEFDGEYFYVGGRTFLSTLKYKNVRAGNARVALVLDDIDEAIKGARGIKVHGRAEIVQCEGHFGAGKPLHLSRRTVQVYFRITPERSWSWGIERAAFENGKPVFQRSSKKK